MKRKRYRIFFIGNRNFDEYPAWLMYVGSNYTEPKQPEGEEKILLIRMT